MSVEPSPNSIYGKKTEIMSYKKPLSQKEYSEIIGSFYQKYSKDYLSELDEFKEAMKDLELYNYHQQGLDEVHFRLPIWVARYSKGNTLYAAIDKRQIVRYWLWENIFENYKPDFSFPSFVREYRPQVLSIEYFKKVYPNYEINRFFVEKEIYKQQSNLPLYYDFSALLYDDGIGIIKIELGQEFMQKVWRSKFIQIRLGEIDKNTSSLPMGAIYERHRPRKDSYSTSDDGYFDLKTLSFTQTT